MKHEINININSDGIYFLATNKETGQIVQVELAHKPALSLLALKDELLILFNDFTIQ